MKHLICKFFWCKYKWKKITITTEQKYPYDTIYYRARKCKRCNKKEFFDYFQSKYIWVNDFDDFTQDKIKKISFK